MQSTYKSCCHWSLHQHQLYSNDLFVSMEDNKMDKGISHEGTGFSWTPHHMFVYRCPSSSTQSRHVSWTLRRGCELIQSDEVYLINIKSPASSKYTAQESGMSNYPYAGWCGSQPTLARSGYWGCVNLWSVSQASEGTKILSEEPAGWWCTVSTDTMFHMIVPIFLCLTLWTAEQGGIGPERFLTLHFELSEALQHWEWWTKTKLRSSLCFTALARGKKRTSTGTATSCKHNIHPKSPFSKIPAHSALRTMSLLMMRPTITQLFTSHWIRKGCKGTSW